jgi:hypothetical protein
MADIGEEDALAFTGRLGIRLNKFLLRSPCPFREFWNWLKYKIAVPQSGRWFFIKGLGILN